MSCPVTKRQKRVVKSIGLNGLPFITDEFLPGEFALNERLPILKPNVFRKTIKLVFNFLKNIIFISAFIGDFTVLHCGFSSDALLWHKDFQDFNYTSIQNLNNQIYITFDGQIVIQKAQEMDSGIYS